MLVFLAMITPGQISYRGTQSECVRPVAEARRTAGIDVFLDTDDIEPLADFPARIRHAIDASHAMIVWWLRIPAMWQQLNLLALAKGLSQQRRLHPFECLHR